jgi:hypothetical protein
VKNDLLAIRYKPPKKLLEITEENCIRLYTYDGIRPLTWKGKILVGMAVCKFCKGYQRGAEQRMRTLLKEAGIDD